MEEIKIVNLTDNSIRLYPDNYTDIEIPVSKKDEQKFLGRCIVIQSSGHARAQISRDSDTARCRIKDFKGAKNVSLNYTHIGIVSGLPEPEDGTIYIVSQLVFQFNSSPAQGCVYYR